MSTRAGAAALALRAKQNLLRLLITKNDAPMRALDHSRYSYADLRSAYLEQIQRLHPDKVNARVASTVDANISSETKEAFVELREAWDRYEQIARTMKRTGKNYDSSCGGFTKFGVGCSFSDNAEERDSRAKIMDQASRGWFSAGEISERGDIGVREEKRPTQALPLACSDMFVQSSDDSNNVPADRRSKPSLVSHPYTNKRL